MPKKRYECDAQKRIAAKIGFAESKVVLMKAVLEGISLAELDQIDPHYDLHEVDWFTLATIHRYTKDINLAMLALTAGVTHDEAKSLYERGDLTSDKIGFIKTMNDQKNVFSYQDVSKPMKQFKKKEKTEFQKILADAKHNLR